MTEPDRPADPVLPVRPGNFLLELVLVPVSDIDRAKAFYSERAGFGVDVDVRPARATLVERGVEVAPVEDLGGVFYASFADPDGNTWTLQHVPWRQ
jgi:predicted lactoylglutathione lyase